MAEAAGVSPKTENEEWTGKTEQRRGSEGGRRGFAGTCLQGFDGEFPGSPPPVSPIAYSWTLRCGFFVVLFLERLPRPFTVTISKS